MRTLIVFTTIVGTLFACVPHARAQFANQQAAQVYAAATQKLIDSNRKSYHVRGYQTKAYSFFPHAEKLLLGETEWQKYFTVLQPRAEIQGKHLSLQGTSAKPGDVVLLQIGNSSSQWMPLVYFGEKTFPQGSLQFSFFIYPYSSRSGLELNTMPPRYHRSMLQDWGILKDNKIGTASGNQSVSSGTTLIQYSTAKYEQQIAVEWLRSPKILGSVFVPTRWWKPGATYVVLRAGTAAPSTVPTTSSPSSPFFQTLYTQKGKGYSTVQSYSHYNHPIDTSPGRLRGRTRIWGDASPEVQEQVIRYVIDEGVKRKMSLHEIALTVAIARVESGFNPDAASNESASGVGQMIDKTASKYGINTNAQRFDARIGAQALVALTLDNLRQVKAKKYSGESADVMTYKLHHDGSFSKDFGGETHARKHVVPWIPKIEPLVKAYVAQRPVKP